MITISRLEYEEMKRENSKLRFQVEQLRYKISLLKGGKDNRTSSAAPSIVKSAVVGSDETGCRVNGKKHWFHVWQTAVLTFIVSFAHRGYAVIEKYFADGFPVSFYASQFQNVDGKGADRYAKIRSVIDTTFKNEQDVYSTLVCLAKCRIVEVPE